MAISFADKAAIRSQSPTSSRLATINGVSAVPIVLFAALHLTNHFVGLWGAQAHIAFMLWARGVYRNPAIEIALVSCFAFQFATGIVLTWRGIARGLADDWMKRLQRILGLSCRLSDVALQCCRTCEISPTQRQFQFAADGFVPWASSTKRTAHAAWMLNATMPRKSFRLCFSCLRLFPPTCGTRRRPCPTI